MADLFSEPAVVGTLVHGRTKGAAFHVVKLGATEKESLWDVLVEWTMLSSLPQQKTLLWTSYIIIGRAGILGDKATGVYESWKEFGEFLSSSLMVTLRDSGFIYHVTKGVGSDIMVTVDSFRPVEKIPVGSDVYACLVVCVPGNGTCDVHGQARRMVRRLE